MPSPPDDPALWPDDDALLAELREALREPGRVPDEWLRSAQASLTWRTVDTDLAVAELTFDSACDPAPAGPTRSEAAARMLAFRGHHVTVEIEVGRAGIVGQLWPEHDGRVSTETTGGVVAEAGIDESGFFTLTPPPPGPVRLHARTAAYTVVTSWVQLA